MAGHKGDAEIPQAFIQPDETLEEGHEHLTLQRCSGEERAGGRPREARPRRLLEGAERQRRADNRLSAGRFREVLEIDLLGRLGIIHATMDRLPAPPERALDR